MVGKSPFAHLSRHSTTPNASTDAQQPESENSSAPPLARRKSTFRLGGGRKSSSDAYILLPSPSPETQLIRRERRTSSQYGGSSAAPPAPSSPTSSFFAYGQPLKKVITNDSGDSAKSTQKQKKSSRLFSLHKKDSSSSDNSTALPLPVLEPLSAPRPPPRPTRSVPPTPAPPFNEELSPSARSRIPLFHSPPARSRITEHNHQATSSDLSSILPSILPSFPEVQSPSKGPAQLDDSPLLSVQALPPVESPPGSPEKEAQRRESNNLIDEEIEEPRPLKVWEEEGNVISDVGSQGAGAAAVEQIETGEHIDKPGEGHFIEGLPELTSGLGLTSLPADNLASSVVSNYPSSSNTSAVASPEHLENLSPTEAPGEDIPFLHLEEVVPQEAVEVVAPDDENLVRGESYERVAKALAEILTVEEEEEEKEKVVVEAFPFPPVETLSLEEPTSPLATKAPIPPSSILTWSDDTLVPSKPDSSPVDTVVCPSLVDKALTAALVCSVAQDASIVVDVHKLDDPVVADEAVPESVLELEPSMDSLPRVEQEPTTDQLAPLDVQVDDTPFMQVDLATLPPLPPSPAVVVHQDLPEISTESIMPPSPVSDHQPLQSTSFEENPTALVVPVVVPTEAAVDLPVHPDPSPPAADEVRSTKPSDQISEAEKDVPPLGQVHPNPGLPSPGYVRSTEPSDQIPKVEKGVAPQDSRPSLTITLPDEMTKEETGTNSHPTESPPSDTPLSTELTTISVTLASLTLALLSTKSLATYQRFLIAAGCLGAHSIFHFAAGLFMGKGRFSDKKGLLNRGTAALGLGGRRLPPQA